jgi:hypothetical protein
MQNHNIAVLEKRHYTTIPRSCLAAVHPQTAESANFTVEESVQYTVNYSSQRSLQLKQRDTPREGGRGGEGTNIIKRVIEAKFMNVLRLEVSVYNVYITIQFQTTFSQGGGESKIR